MMISDHPRSVTGEKVLYIGSSISYHCDFDVLRNETGAEVITRKAYSTVFDRNARFPDKNFSTVLHREVSAHQPTLLIVQTSSVDITLIREKSLSWADAVKAAKRSSFDILCLAWSLLCDNPNIQQIILSKRTPRIDCPLRKQLTEIANDELIRLHSLYCQSKIHIGEHNLQCSSVNQTAALFGAKGNGRYDGWHLYGNQGVKRYTDSVLNILCKAGVALKSSTKTLHHTVTPAPSPVKSSAPHPNHSTVSVKVKSKPCIVQQPLLLNFTQASVTMSRTSSPTCEHMIRVKSIRKGWVFGWQGTRDGALYRLPEDFDTGFYLLVNPLHPVPANCLCLRMVPVHPIQQSKVISPPLKVREQF